MRFVRCRMTAAVLSSAAMHHVRFDGGSLAEIRGAGSLRGATISSDLVLPLVPSVFAEAGIRINDESDPHRVDD